MPTERNPTVGTIESREGDWFRIGWPRALKGIGASPKRMLSGFRRDPFRHVAWGVFALAVILAIVLGRVFYLRTTAVGDASERLGLQFELGKNLLGLIGVALAFLFLYYARRRAVTAEEGLLADRLREAIEQLGATREKNDGSPGREPSIEIRMGAIYALAHLAKDSRKYHWTVMEVLTAYVRANAPWNKEIEEAEKQGKREPRSKPREDIQAILLVLGRRRIDLENLEDEDVRIIDLRKTDLRGAILTDNIDSGEGKGLNYARANLSGANLSDAKLGTTDLSRAYCREANLGRAELWCTNLRFIDLAMANLKEANIEMADLSNADLCDANLKGADLYDANLKNANLSLADLRNADLKRADLCGVLGLWQESLDQAEHCEGTQLPEDLINRAEQLRKHDEQAGESIKDYYVYGPNWSARPWQNKEGAPVKSRAPKRKAPIMRKKE